MSRRFFNASFAFRRLFSGPTMYSCALGLGATAAGLHYASSGHRTSLHSIATECEQKSTSAPYLAPRLKLRNEMMRTCNNVGVMRTFPVIFGVDGSGKTTMIRNVIGDLETDAVYFDITSNATNIEVDLSKLLGFPGTSIDLCIVQAADKFYQTNRRPMTLVLDSVENLARASPSTLQKLLLSAKECLNHGTAKIIFVCNDSAVNIVQSDAVWSSVDPIEVPELTELESIQYLTASSIPASEAKEAVLGLTGGNLHLLKRFVDCRIGKGQKLDVIRSAWTSELSGNLEGNPQLSLSNYQLGLKLLSDKKSISTREALDYFSRGDLKRLIDQGVLSFHSGARFLKFRNKLVERYFADKYGKT